MRPVCSGKSLNLGEKKISVQKRTVIGKAFRREPAAHHAPRLGLELRVRVHLPDLEKMKTWITPKVGD